MKWTISALAAAALSAAVLATPARAHFQLIYTPEVNLEKAGDIPLLLVFWHPFSNGQAMDMGKPEQFFVVHKGEKTDLLSKLQPITFKGAENSAAGYEAKVSVRRLGDYIFVLVPAPYLEKSEDKYIQQITKSYMNVGGTPTGWDKPLGLATRSYR
jgi:nickel transport protein